MIGLQVQVQALRLGHFEHRRSVRFLVKGLHLRRQAIPPSPEGGPKRRHRVATSDGLQVAAACGGLDVVFELKAADAFDVGRFRLTASKCDAEEDERGGGPASVPHHV